MQTSKMEKMILAVLLSLLIVIGYYETVFKYERKSILSLTDQNKAAAMKLENMNFQIASAPNIKKNIKILNYKIEEGAGKLYPQLNQDKLLLQLNSIYKKAGITGNIDFTGNSTEENSSDNSSDDESKEQNDNSAVMQKLNKLVARYNTEFLQKSTALTDTSDSTKSLKANVTFKGSYNNIIKFISNIEKNQNKIAISGITLGGGDSSSLSGTATLEFYSVPQFADMNIDYNRWNYNKKYGKTNPFSSKAQSGYYRADTAENNDFVMSIKSVNSDLPAIMFGKYDDSKRESYIYEDENKTEDMEIVVTEKDGKFYYKYKSKDSSYPVQYNGYGMEFTPSGEDISIIIYSSNRISSDDNTAVSLTVYNKASKNVRVIVTNDDVTNPRVTVNGKGGDVEITNK